MWRITILLLVSFVVVTVVLLGLRGDTSTRPPLTVFRDMVDQPKYQAQGASPFFADGRAQRMPPANAVPWGRNSLAPDTRFALADEQRFGMSAIPIPLDRAALVEGRRLYGVYCTVCHGGAGEGNGITTHYGMNPPPSYHQQRLREVPDGEIYRTITEGRNTMGPYGSRLTPDQRWMIVAWVRVLQRAFDATLDDVPESLREELKR